MKSRLQCFLLCVLLSITATLTAQVTRLSNNTNLETGISMGNFAVLISESDSLWRTDGTVGGTFKYATNVAVDSPYSYMMFLNKIFFRGTNGNGDELWVTDGTPGGTQMVKDIITGPASGAPSHFIVHNNALYFFASDGVNGTELWKSDGTDAGTAMLKDINPGPGSSLTTFTTYHIHNGELFFVANDGTSGTELWKTNGTSTGTVLVKDINPGAGSSNPGGFYNYGSIFLFTASEPMTAAFLGGELWKSDGTTTGTELLKDINPGPVGSLALGFTLFNNKVYFNAYDATNGFEGWVTDGTSTNTTLLKDINPGEESGFPLFLNALFLNNKMYFQATTADDGSELWTSDGTGTQTLLFKDINPGADSSSPLFLLNTLNVTNINDFHSNLFNGILFLEATTAANGTELWKTDGTDAGTVLVKDINPGSDSSLTDSATYFYTPSHLYFAANDGTAGTELWKSDGTGANTNLVFDINPGGSGSEPQFLLSFNGIYLFTATDGDSPDNRDLFRLDGTFAPLPLNLLNFSSTVYGKNVRLNWTSVAETKTSHFVVERSPDGARFETIGSVKAAGNSAEKRSYAFDDFNAGTTASSKLFYRLKMVDTDGKFTFSKVVAVRWLKDEGILVYPNPVKTSLNVVVKSETAGPLSLKVFDEGGKLVHSRQAMAARGTTSYVLNLASFVKGTYYINIETPGETRTARFVKE